MNPDDYIHAVYIVKNMVEHGNLPETIGVYKGTIISTTHGDWFVWKTKTGYTIQKAYNK
jgi:hypothetical protein